MAASMGFTGTPSRIISGPQPPQTTTTHTSNTTPRRFTLCILLPELYFEREPPGGVARREGAAGGVA